MQGIFKFLKSNWFHFTILLLAILTFCYGYYVDPLQNERIFLRTVFQFHRRLYDNTLGHLPFAFVYVLFVLILVWLGKGIYDTFRFIRERKYLTIILRLFSSAGLIYFLFYFSWGFNYKNRPIHTQLNLPRIAVDSNMVYADALHLIGVINALRDSLSSDTCHLSEMLYSEDTEDQLRTSLTQLFKKWYLPIGGKVRVRAIAPDGILLRIATAGIYLPFAMEGHIDKGLPKVQWPFVMAHEMSHGYGITDEGECNFVAVLVCANAKDPYIRYSGLLSYWRYMANSLLRIAPTLGQKLVDKRSVSIKNDTEYIKLKLNSYPDYLPVVRDQIYDAYLKKNGVASGIESYGTVINLMQRWQFSFHNRDLYEELYGSASFTGEDQKKKK
ncbi:MAG: DUF3810 family protein [Saprospiraceae bacterium]|nr:DUF3810 family protein [Saprospiraceae bacterium]MBP7643300.1 DUF3810 family protein [Saprospiraceae bacterium]